MKTFKNFISESNEPPKGYEHHLKDEHAIADHIEKTSADEVDRGSMLDYFHGAEAKLKKTPLSDIKSGDADHNIPSKKKQAKYSKMPSETRPPIVIEKGTVVDGHHRYRDAVKKGETHVWAYHVTDRD
jgi:hypothetical protein